MIKPQNQFRHLNKFKSIFLVDDKTVFAWDNVIYSNYDLPEDIIIHEQEHFRQQKEYGLKTWLRRYLNEKNFRFKMEKLACIAQLKSIKDKGLKEAVLQDIINILSSGLYGKISKEEAEFILKN